MAEDAPKEKSGVDVVKEMFGKVSSLNKEKTADTTKDIPCEIRLIVREKKILISKRRQRQ